MPIPILIPPKVLKSPEPGSQPSKTPHQPIRLPPLVRSRKGVQAVPSGATIPQPRPTSIIHLPKAILQSNHGNFPAPQVSHRELLFGIQGPAGQRVPLEAGDNPAQGHLLGEEGTGGLLQGEAQAAVPVAEGGVQAVADPQVEEGVKPLILNIIL